MQRVTIYSTMLCPFCWRAKRLLDLKGFDYEEIDIMETPG
ncbi:MAG: glutaredoxin domain-containing protein, partial [Alphaproteobacteria bacterium]